MPKMLGTADLEHSCNGVRASPSNVYEEARILMAFKRTASKGKKKKKEKIL